ncbi:hypothetical protein GCM10027570_25390 [Streptomonospora sediminis]
MNLAAGTAADTAAPTHDAPPPAAADRPRIPFLDAARGWAMIGVVLINAGSFVTTVAAMEGSGGGLFAEGANAAASLLFSGRSRELLMLLFGIGAALTWRSATRRGERPVWLLVRRYAALFAVFGLAHRYVFDGDILTLYSLTALVLVPLLPFLLGGARWRPVAVAAALLPISAGLHPFLPPLPFDAQFGLSTLAAFAVGVWLARLPRLAGEATDATDAAHTARRPLGGGRLAGLGAVVFAAGGAAAGGATLAFPRRFGPDGVPEPQPAVAEASMSLGNDVLLVGGALLYFGLIWWLADRGGKAARALAVLAPIGRMSLTVYLGSTALFLITVSGNDAASTAVQLGIAAGYVLAAGVLCPLWLRFFRYGPAEWLWRCLTYLRLLPVARRRESAAQA